MSEPFKPQAIASFGTAWLLLGLAFALHIWDLAAHHFLTYYNATALVLYGHFSWLPRLDMEFRNWLVALVLANVIFLVLTPWAFQNTLWLRPSGYFLAALALLESSGQFLLTMRGRTTGSVQFEGVSPGFYTAPLLLAVAAFLFWRLHQTAVTTQRLSKG
jgi:hypothetical protein